MKPYITEALNRPQKGPNMVLNGQFSQPYSQYPVQALTYVRSRLCLVLVAHCTLKIIASSDTTGDPMLVPTLVALSPQIEQVPFIEPVPGPVAPVARRGDFIALIMGLQLLLRGFNTFNVQIII